MIFSLVILACSESSNTSQNPDISELQESQDTAQHTSEPAQEPTTEPAQEPSQPAQEPSEEPAQEPTTEPAQEPATEPQYSLPRLHIALTWIHAGDDMDLHVLNGTDMAFRNTDQDCYYENCSNGLDWGVAGETQDNPILLQHDDSGTGPEIITIDHPHDGAIYTLLVHDYPESLFEFDHNVSVEITIDEVVICSITKNVYAENSHVPFAQLDWDTKSCTEL